jgi:hypothetical protein
MQFQLNENKIALLLCLLGIAIGLTIGIFIKDGTASFHMIGHISHFAIEIIGYQIPSLILFGAIVGLMTQIISVWLSWLTLAAWGTELYHTRIAWLLMGIPMGILIVFNIFSDRLVALGFVITYTIDLLLPWIPMIIVGWHTMHLLWFNGISLLILYLISNLIIWSIEFGRSIV